MSEIWFDYYDEKECRELTVQVLFKVIKSLYSDSTDIMIVRYCVYRGVCEIPLIIDEDILYNETWKAIRYMEIDEEMK